MGKVKVKCPNCSATYSVDQGFLGKKARCAKCNTTFILASVSTSQLSSPTPFSDPVCHARSASLAAVDTQTPDQPSRLSGWLPGQVMLGDYRVERKIGEGGMGKVLLVKSVTTGQQFAVKLAKFADPDHRRNFLAELRAWIDLPGHPHLVACRFFRTLGDEVSIFAEFVGGGSLADWIASRQLYEGDQRKALERILDVAIQFAWGLDALHELGLVHQDVKPGNVLLTADGQVKVTDFGLTRARALTGQSIPGGRPPGILVSFGGRTPAYCSPEQAEGQKLSPKTDIWSWGVSVLEMFTGEVTWMAGQAAAEVLESYLESGPQEPQLPAMPHGLAEVLKKCFRQEPNERWASMGMVSDAIKRVYAAECKREYSRGEPPAVQARAAAIEHDRRVSTGYQWTEPRLWLERAFRAEGRDPAAAASLLAPRTGSRQAQAIADIAAYDEARRIFEDLVASGRRDLEDELAELCMQKAFIHLDAGDMPGALAMYDRAIVIRERLVNREGRWELTGDLAKCYTNKAAAVRAMGDNRGAVGLYDRAIAIYERLVNQEGRRELAGDLAMCYMDKANAVSLLRDTPGAVGLYDRAIAIYERLVNQEGKQELAGDMAMCYMNEASAVSLLGDKRRGVSLYDRAIAIYERLVNQEGRRELAHPLANCYMNKAAAVRALGDSRGALGLHDRAIAIHERLVNQEARRELADALAMDYMNKAVAVGGLGDNRGAAGLYDRAIDIYERLVNQEGRRELAHPLANCHMSKANALRALGDDRDAGRLYDRAIAIYERLVSQEGRHELADALAKCYMNKAHTVRALGDDRGAGALYDRAIAIYERLVSQEGRHELADALANCYVNKAHTVRALGESRGAGGLYDRAIDFCERQLSHEGRWELAYHLAQSYMSKAQIVGALGDHRGAVRLHDRAIAIYEGFVNQGGLRALAGDLAWVQLLWADETNKLGQRDEAARVARTALQTLKSEIARTGRADLQGVVDWAHKNLADLLCEWTGPPPLPGASPATPEPVQSAGDQKRREQEVIRVQTVRPAPSEQSETVLDLSRTGTRTEPKPVPPQAITPAKAAGKQIRCSCGFENPVGNQFCNQCGKELLTAGGLECPHCQKTVPPGVKFCVHCGKPVAHNKGS